jgi:dTDP-4-dehydrorhamnose 3,5-epimerase
MAAASLAAMQLTELVVPGAFEITPEQHSDDRGVFFEWFHSDSFVKAVGHELPLAQANCSVSRRGVVRGIHFAEVPPGQAKYVTCVSGAVLDVVVDLRVGSPRFGQHDAVLLDDDEHKVVYVPIGLGHGFVALSDDATVMYLCSQPYNPTGEHAVSPLDPALGLPWPADLDLVLSDKDRGAPTLAEAESAGWLPRWEGA